MLIFPPDVG